MGPQLPLFILALAFVAFPSVDAGLFPKKSNVKHLDAKEFRKALKDNRSFVTAFVAPWCGHCQKLVPELVRAADGLHPLVPVYAVDCDDNQNKPICAEQGVQGFPTIKVMSNLFLFQVESEEGPKLKVIVSSAFSSRLFYWASRAVPSTISRTQTAKGISEFVAKNSGKPKAMLLNKSNKTPLLWKVLSNKYSDQIAFGNCRDRKGKVSVELGYEAGDSKVKVLIYGSEDKEPTLYEGVLKYAALSKFFDQVLEGTIDISRASLDAKQEILKVPESERQDLDDETRIGDAGYAGFNPHEGLDMDELLKHGPNPHAAGHPGANPHGAHAPESSSSSPKPDPSSATEAAPADSEAPSKPETTAAAEEPIAPVEPSSERAKDEL